MEYGKANLFIAQGLAFNNKHYTIFMLIDRDYATRALNPG